MEQVVPWDALLAVVEPFYPKSGQPGGQPMPLSMMLRIHCLQREFDLSDPRPEALIDPQPGGTPIPGHQLPVWLCQGPFKGLAKNAAQVFMLVGLATLYLKRRELLASHEQSVQRRAGNPYKDNNYRQSMSQTPEFFDTMNGKRSNPVLPIRRTDLFRGSSTWIYNHATNKRSNAILNNPN
jgi:hypothetical protein